MARRKYIIDERRAAKFHKEGRGQGSGASYKPWLTIHDVPSIGRSHRLLGISTGRIHHFLSDLEHDLFLLLDWQSNTVDLREQFPLELRATLDIADRLNIRHPRVVSTPAQAWIMTTDIVQDIRGTNGIETRAYAVKTASDLEKSNTLQKLEIEWHYWQDRGIPWKIITRAELPQRMIDNIAWIRDFSSSHGLQCRSLELIPHFLEEIVASPQLSVGKFCFDADTRYNLPSGSSLALMRHLLATREVTCDMEHVVLNVHLPFSSLKIGQQKQRRRRA